MIERPEKVAVNADLPGNVYFQVGRLCLQVAPYRRGRVHGLGLEGGLLQPGVHQHGRAVGADQARGELRVIENRGDVFHLERGVAGNEPVPDLARVSEVAVIQPGRIIEDQADRGSRRGLREIFRHQLAGAEGLAVLRQKGRLLHRAYLAERRREEVQQQGGQHPPEDDPETIFDRKTTNSVEHVPSHT